jgi:membrane protein involved in colicin uptake
VEIIVESGDPVLCSEAVVAAARKAGKSVRESLG